MQASERGVISVSILREGDVLAVALTDFRAIGRLGRVAVDPTRLDALRSCADRLARAASGGGVLADQALQDFSELGAAIFALLPPAVREVLRSSEAPRSLHLQLDPSLVGIAWECAHDGTAFLGEKFCVSRRIASEEPAPAPASTNPQALRVLVCGSVDGAETGSLLPRLDGLDGVLAEQLSAAEFRDGVWQRLPEGGHRLVCSEPMAPHDELLQFVLAARCELAGGVMLGKAVRRARLQRRAQGPRAAAALLGIALYGEAEQALAVRAEPLPDSLRQMTILSYDLVGSTRLMASLGAERYSELLANYHHRCAEIVARHGGVSDDPQGDDGIMCYFGFPVAREGSAAEALRAGLAIAAAMDGLGLRVRLGAATGQVVVNAGQPVGVAVHLAARLQALAEPGSLAVSEATRRLAQDTFAFELIDAAPRLKGIERPGAVHRVVAEQLAPIDPFDRAPRLTPFIGREQELQWLGEQWSIAAAGQAQCVLVSGDAGIGKSRLVREFRRGLAPRGQQAIECRCAADHAHTAFHAPADFLRRLLQFQDGDSGGIKLGKIRDGLGGAGLGPQAVELIAQLLGVPTAPPLPGDKQREATLELLVAWVKHALDQGPVLLVVEDAHWIDPSTREFLDRLLVEAAALPLMLLATQRLEAAPRWQVGTEAGRIELKRLPPEPSRAIVLAACGATRLPAALVRALAARADGVPLFLEESARMAIDAGLDEQADEAALALRFTVPATIHDLLMARLDRLGGAKQVAQLGAALGREFSAALLQAVMAHARSPIRLVDATAQLELLTGSGLLVRKGEGARAGYFFKHALVRDTAYQSLWERDRKRLHHAVATVLKDQFAGLAHSQPELLAYHYSEAGLQAEAIVCWEQAARRAAASSAHDEAISHVRSALALVPALPAAPERDRGELRLQLLLAGRLIATEGYGAGQVERAHARAAELCHSLGDEAALLKLQLGREGFHFMRGNFEQAHAHASQAAIMASRSPDPMASLHCRWSVANILFHQGEVATAVELMDACLHDYDRLQHRPGAVQDPGVMCLCYSAWGQWQLGHPDDALARAEGVVELAARLDHKFSMGEAWGFRTTVHHFRGETAAALAGARRAIEICEDGGFAVWLAHARLMHGRLLAEQGEVAAGLEQMHRAYEAWVATGAVVTRPFYLALQAEGQALAGAPEAGLALLDAAREIVVQHGERYYEAEIHRLSGELLLQAAAAARRDRSAEAEACFAEALRCARSLRLHGLALRGALALARLWAGQGREAAAWQLLAEARSRVRGGASTRDVRQATHLLEALRPAAAPLASSHQ